MEYKVFLKLHKDDNIGVYGLVHENSYDKGFNSFWSVSGIFHDCFEHYFEDYFLPYFMNKYSFQLYGEMCAQGHAIAYCDIGIDSLYYEKNRTNRDFISDTSMYLEDWLNDYTDYLEYPIDNISVPKQCIKDIYLGSVDYYLNKYNDFLFKSHHKNEKKLKSIKFSNIRNCYIYGYRRAMKIIGKDKGHSYDVISNFLEEVSTIVKYDPSEIIIYDEEAYSIKGFNVYVRNNNKLEVSIKVVDEINNEYPISSITY